MDVCPTGGRDLTPGRGKVDNKRVVARSSSRRPLRAIACLLIVTLAAYVAHLGLGVGGHGIDRLFNDFVYNGLMLAAALLCLSRALLVRKERAAWLIIGLGLLSWLAADVYWTAVLADLDSPPVPSLADGLYLGFYPAGYVGLLLLVRSRVAHLPRAAWLDGGIAAAAVGSVVAALAFKPILAASTGDAVGVATNLAYPIGDLLMMALVVTVWGLSGWRPGRAWLLIGSAMALMALADGIYLFQSATDSYVEGTLLDAMWPASMLLVGTAAWQPAQARVIPRLEGLRVSLVPCLSALVALFALTWDHYHRLNQVALILTVVTLLLVTLRMVLTLSDNARILMRVRSESITDSLTGLRNRRALMDDLEEQAGCATEAAPLGLLLFDLDGFKQYNDSFGHPAGDVLLARLGGRLQEAIAPYGCAYRLGGDEFCALVHPGATGLERIATLGGSALYEIGDGFTVSTSHGAACMPLDSADPTEALQVADRRMYARKGRGRASAMHQARDVLLRTLREREPDLRDHVAVVADLAERVGRMLELPIEQLDELRRAAELHDIGKMGIPDAILGKPGPLDDAERDFMQRHTVIGEQILGAAPALRPVAKIVRSSHERWDGAGYPDRLSGTAIPIGSRIVAVCDAYHAMTSDRPYRASISPDDALAEIERCSGSQFDPGVVAIFAESLRAPALAEAAAASA
jgi:two-component system, cell cycle response regulator